MTSVPARSAATAAAVGLSLLTLTATAPAALAGPPSPDLESVDAVAEVQQVGYAVTALALAFDRPVHLGEVDDAASQVTVTATLGGTTAARTVTSIYASREPAPGDPRRTGRYVVVELSAADPNANVLYSDARGVNLVRDLQGAFTVDLGDGVQDVHGRTVLPATDAVANTGVVSPVVDDYAHGLHEASSGVDLPYAIYTPEALRRSGERSARTYPLVLTLHGAGARGENGVSQLLVNELSTAFAEPESQRDDPAFVLSPQAPVGPVGPGGSAWQDEAVQDSLLELLDEVLATYPVDRDRIYVAGLSMGAMGIYDLLPKHPDLFAGALTATGSGDPATALQTAPITASVPVWGTHSVDDFVVRYDTPFSDHAIMRAIESSGTPVTFDGWAANLSDAENEANAQAQWDLAERRDSDHLFTTWSAGTTPVNAHFAWVPTFSNATMIDWLFSQRR
jgi:predicted peptidase